MAGLYQHLKDGWRPWRRMHRHYRRGYFDEKEIARKRYASGEITRKQYLEILKDLDETAD